MEPAPPVEVGRTADGAELAAWRLTLEALGIAYRLVPSLEGWTVLVPPDREEAARRALTAASEEEREEPERRAQAEAVERTELAKYRFSWLPGVLFAAALVEAAYWAGFGDRGWDTRWFRAGANVLALTGDGQPWRAVTALTLHANFAHLALNALAGIFLLPMACEFWGTGMGVLLTVIAGALGNWLEARIGGPVVSVGASTALFAALGVAGGTRLLQRGTSAREGLRILIVVVVMFALFGLGGQTRDPLDILFPRATDAPQTNVDVLAHVLGLTLGLMVGAAARRVVRERPGALAQWLAGALAAALVVGCWALAMPAVR